MSFVPDPYPEEYYTYARLMHENQYLRNKIECERLKGWLIKNGYPVPDEPVEVDGVMLTRLDRRVISFSAFLLVLVYFISPGLLSRQVLRYFLFYGFLSAIAIAFMNIFLASVFSWLNFSEKILRLALKYFALSEYLLSKFFCIYLSILVYYFIVF